MSSIFDDLEKMGFGKIDDKEIFASEEKKKEKEDAEGTGDKAKEIKEIKEIKEEEFLFDKKYDCPICDAKFTDHAVRVGKTRRIGADLDLRPKYSGVDAIKYDIVLCKKCGYAAMSSSFAHVSPLQRKMIKEQVQASFKGVKEGENCLSYEEAITRFKLALYSAVVKRSRNSEKAYLCLKTAWLYRGYGEQLETMAIKDEEKIEECRKADQEYTERAQVGFEAAVANEMFPICGMDEMTFNYLLAELYHRGGKIDACRKQLGLIMMSKSASPVLKDRARKLKEVLMEEKKGE